MEACAIIAEFSDEAAKFALVQEFSKVKTALREDSLNFSTESLNATIDLVQKLKTTKTLQP